MEKVAESEGVPAQRFEPAVDRLGGPVRGPVVEVRQHIGTSAVQGASELGKFVETVRHPERIVSMTRVNCFLPRRRSWSA